MLVELIENGMEAEKRKQQEFFDLAERFRRATDAKEITRLGDQTGRMGRFLNQVLVVTGLWPRQCGFERALIARANRASESRN